MDGATLSPYPHYSWLAHRIAVRPPNVFAFHEQRHVSHRLLLTITGEARVTWTTRGNEETFRSAVGDIGFYQETVKDHQRRTLTLVAARQLDGRHALRGRQGFVAG